MDVLDGLFRWLHVVAGILWIGLLYFFNFVNANFAPTMDAETKKKVVPELLPRALFWFRWGAAFTWVTGVLLLMLVYYHGGLLLEPGHSWGLSTFAMLAIAFFGVFVYDVLYKGPLKDPQVGFWAGLVIATGILFLFQLSGFTVRAYAIHLGTLFGTTMAFNVWFRIWPAQRRIITATKSGAAPDPADVGLAGTRSRHNTYMSVPLVFMMLGQHTVSWANHPLVLGVIVLAGWATVYHLYDRAKKVPGF
jgi:uncharacterized membrane protein